MFGGLGLTLIYVGSTGPSPGPLGRSSIFANGRVIDGFPLFESVLKGAKTPGRYVHQRYHGIRSSLEGLAVGSKKKNLLGSHLSGLSMRSTIFMNSTPLWEWRARQSNLAVD